MNYPEDRLFINNIGPYAFKAHIEVEKIEVTPMSETVPNRKWYAVDEKGHFHSFDMVGKDRLLPTLKSKTHESEYACIDCGEIHKEITVTYHCILCGEEINPHYITVLSRYEEYVPGKTTVKLDVTGSVKLDNPTDVVSFYSDAYFGTARFLSYVSKPEGIVTTFLCNFLGQRFPDGL